MGERYSLESNMKQDNRLLIDLYTSMLLIRRVEEKIVELYPEQEMRCPVHLCIGEEAIAVGVCKNLAHEDIIFSNHRSHGHYIAKGGDIKAMLTEIYGKVTGCAKGRGGSMHLIDLSANFFASIPIVGGSVPLAAGTAFASKLQKKGNISVVFFGDATAEAGVLHETLNFSSLHKLPVLFICENNLYASQTHISARQPDRPIYKLAEPHGIVAYQADGNDVVKVYEVTKKAVEHIKSGKGPAFIEFLTYRWREHVGPNPDHDLGYRTQEEVLSWQKRCPIEKLKNKLLHEKILTENEMNEIERKIKQEIDEAVSFAKKSPFPDSTELNKYLFKE